MNAKIDLGPMGIGTNVWGRRGKASPDIIEVFKAAVEAGISFIDTAELYQGGGSERSVALALAERRKAKPAGPDPKILSKFFPWPWRLSPRALKTALEASLGRLGLPLLDVYLLHFPLPPVPLESWVNALGEAVEAGLARAVGVSNCGPEQVRLAHEVLARRGIPLACDEIEYSLLNRRAERNGTLSTCSELGVPIIAYRPLGLGLLPSAVATIPGARKLMAPKTDAAGLESLRKLLAEIGAAHGGKTAAQVALNWTIAKGTIPIPGARSVAHLKENTGALGWELEASEVEALDKAADRASRLSE